MTSGQVYVYAVTGPDCRPPGGAETVGPGDSALRTVIHRGLAAVVSDFDGDWIPASRKNLRAHSDVVQLLGARGPVIPLQFGVLFKDEHALVDELLHPSRRSLQRTLRRLDGLKEFRVQARYRGDVAIREAAETDGSVKRLLRAGAGQRGGYHDQIALGEAVAAAVRRINEQDATDLLHRLAPSAEDYRMLDGDPSVVAFSGAFLIAEARRDAFEEELKAAARIYRDRMTFRLVGPLPAWDFVDLEAEAVHHADDRKTVRSG